MQALQIWGARESIMSHFSALRDGKEEEEDGLNEPTLIDGSFGLGVYGLVWARSLVLRRINHCNRALRPGELLKGTVRVQPCKNISEGKPPPFVDS